MKRYKLDIMMEGSSRPELVPYCIESLKRFIISPSKNTDFRIIFNEDFVDVNKSNQVIAYLEKNKIDVIIKNNPKKGYGHAIYNMLNNHVKSDYVMNLQEDWEFERTGIDIDRILYTMMIYNIWSIVFHKYRMGRYKGDHFNEEMDFDGMKLVLCNGWREIPSIWKTSIAREHWTDSGIGEITEGKLINSFGSGKTREDKNYCEKKVRSYYFGTLNDQRWVRHIGNTWRNKDVPNRYGRGCTEWDILDLRDKPPWIPYEIRPMNIKWCEAGNNKEQMKYFNDLLDKFPEDIRRQFKR